MNKNTLLAIAIMLSTIFVVQSPLFKESALYRLMGGQSPSELEQQAKVLATKAATKPTPTTPAATAQGNKDSVVVDTLTPPSNDTVVLENELMTLTLEEKGAAIIGVILKNYTYGTDHPRANQLVSLLNDSTKSIAGLQVAGIDLRETHFELDTLLSTQEKLVFTTLVEGKPLTKSFTLPKSSYYVDLKVTSPLFEARSETVTKLFFDAGIEETQTATGISPSQTLRTVTLNNTEKTKRYTPKKITELRQEVDTYRWASLSSKYFTTAVILPQATPATITMANWAIVPTEKIAPKNMDFALIVEHATPKAGTSYSLFLGPNERSSLAQSDVGLEKTLFRGYAWFFFANLWFPGLCEFVLWLLGLFFILAKDYGIAILLLTLLLKVATFPMSQSSMKSMAAMSELKPKLDKLQAKYKNNPQVLQQKTMELYREEGINPLASLGGCIPMILQMPIMIALFLVLQKAIELRGETTFLLPWVTDLSQNEVLFTVPFSILGVNYFAILPILSGVLMYFQNKKTMTDPAQRQMMMMMPPMMAVMFYTMPAGLNFYFVLSSLFQIIQQFLVDHSKKKKEGPKDVITVKASKVK